jgi:hypothetical protein
MFDFSPLLDITAVEVLFLVGGLGVSHFVGDFLLQSNWMALGKSKRLVPLLTHALVYSLCFLWLGPAFVAITFLCHTITDFCTSRLTSSLWFVSENTATWIEGCACGDRECWTTTVVYDSAKRHWFFVVIGFDQLLHQIQLLTTLLAILP